MVEGLLYVGCNVLVEEVYWVYVEEAYWVYVEEAYWVYLRVGVRLQKWVDLMCE